MKNMKNIAGIFIGNTIYALGIVLFVLPNGLIMGGTTGIALIVDAIFHLPIATFVTVFNLTMFCLGWKVLGKTFALTTLISSFYYPFILGVFQSIVGDMVLTQDILLSVILAGLMIGVAIGLVIRCGASTGGMDIPPLILNKKLALPVSVGMYMFDFFILIGQMMIRDREMVLYGILLVLIYTFVLEKVLVIGKSQIQVKIISQHYEEISTMILEQLDRGVTLLHGETGYLHHPYPVILTVVNPREIALLNEKVNQIDAEAFMIINQVNEVKGHGFTASKKYQNLKEV